MPGLLAERGSLAVEGGETGGGGGDVWVDTVLGAGTVERRIYREQSWK